MIKMKERKNWSKASIKRNGKRMWYSNGKLNANRKNSVGKIKNKIREIPHDTCKKKLYII